MTFDCTSCGLCCTHIPENEPDVQAVHGVCTKLDPCTHLCTIYEHRPLKCRVVDGYSLFKDKMSEEAYLEANYKACADLQKEYENALLHT